MSDTIGGRTVEEWDQRQALLTDSVVRLRELRKLIEAVRREERKQLSESIACNLECVANSPLGNAETERVLRFEASKIREGGE
jgi:hypothetical protein